VGDPDVLTRALLELVDNAVKYSPDGGRVEIRAHAVDSVVAIEVEDEGIGFPPEQLDELMRDFSQGDASSTRRFGGLGLGLPFVSRIAVAHGGRLVATSRPGGGSTFSLELPAAKLLKATTP
jgi:signal transduction histidine kinase